MDFTARVQQVAARPGSTPLVVLLGVLLCAPSLGNGLDLDDVLQAARLADDGSGWRLFDLFGGAAPMVADADLPWWRHEDLRIAFMRSLASASHAFDHALFAGRPGWMHLHSLLWYAALLVVAGRVYARLIPARWACLLALLLYAVDHTHGMVVGWLAARCGSIGATAALLCLWAHDRWRREGWGAGGLLAPVALLAALLANEGAVGICGYLAAHAAFLDRGSRLRRWTALLPAAGLVLAWRWYYVAAGYGVAHSGFYFDPGADPAGAVVRATGHGAILVVSQIFVSAGEALGMAPGLYLAGGIAAMAVLAALGLRLRGALRRSAELRFWAVGTLLCALPLGATLPTDRQLLLIGFGVFGFAARLACEPNEPTMGRAWRWFAGGWLALHVAVSPLLLPLRAISPAHIQEVVDRGMDAVATESSPGQVVLLRAPSDLLMFYGRARAKLLGRPFPAVLRHLYAGTGELTVTRVDEHTLELRPALGWLYAPLDRIFRGEEDPFTAGETVEVDGMRVEVLAVSGDGRPLVARFRFARPLSDRGYAWFSWESRAPSPLVLPAIGETLRLPAIGNPLLGPGAPGGAICCTAGARAGARPCRTSAASRRSPCAGRRRP